MQQEMQKYLRREDVCRRLREVAEDTKDLELARQADILESRAWVAYEQKVASTRFPKMNTFSDATAEAKGSKNTSTVSSKETGSVHSIPGDGQE
jgi:hypothetical protein